MSPLALLLIAAPLQASINVVAHQDDDVLFMNPQIEEDIKAKRQVVTIFTTGGDAGMGERQWASREKGIKAAYALMAGHPEPTKADWSKGAAEISVEGEKKIVVSASLGGITFYFMRLPDGNYNGAGFGPEKQSMAKVLADPRGETKIRSLDGKMEYNRKELIETVRALIQKGGGHVRTLNPDGARDHSDHVATAKIVGEAMTGGSPDIFLADSCATSGRDLNDAAKQARKTEIFRLYARHDYDGDLQPCLNEPENADPATCPIEKTYCGDWLGKDCRR